MNAGRGISARRLFICSFRATSLAPSSKRLKGSFPIPIHATQTLAGRGIDVSPLTTKKKKIRKDTNIL